jgi:hypothetical protein
MKQNNELRNIIEELKAAAIETIVEKNDQIEALEEKVIKVEKANQVLEEKNEELEQTIIIKDH